MSSSLHTKSSLAASKVPELKALCTKNGLPVSGNKSDLIARLMAHFEIPESRSATVTPRKDATSTTPATSTAAPAAQPDLSAPTAVREPASAPTQPAPASAHVPAAEPAAAPVPATPASKPSSTHPPPSAIEAEMEKRRQRAERFGLVNGSAAAAATPAASTDEELRKLERAKRFGVTPDAEQKIQALDQPLGDGKRSEAGTGAPKSVADMEWEARKRKRAEKFGLVDNPPSKDDGMRRKHPKASRF